MFTLFLLITGHLKIINKSLSHYRFFYSAFLPRKCKSNICLCEVALLFFKDIPKTQQWPRIWQKQCKKNPQKPAKSWKYGPAPAACSAIFSSHTFSLTRLISVLKIPSNPVLHKQWVPATFRGCTLMQVCWNDTRHPLAQLFHMHIDI